MNLESLARHVPGLMIGAAEASPLYSGVTSDDVDPCVEVI